MSYIGIIITFVLINNFILTQFLGLCPFIGVSRKTDSAVGMGFAVIFVMSMASLATWAVYRLILVPLNIEYLQTISFILIIAALVQLVELVIMKISPPLRDRKSVPASASWSSAAFHSSRDSSSEGSPRQM